MSQIGTEAKATHVLETDNHKHLCSKQNSQSWLSKMQERL